MTSPQEIAILGGLVIISGALKDVAVDLIKRGLHKNGNGFCSEHAGMKDMIQQIYDEHREERRVDVIVKAIKKANGDASAIRHDLRD